MTQLTFCFTALLAASCYSFTPPDGLACSAERQCPKGQLCAADDRCYDIDSPLNDDSSLANLEVSAGGLEPAFDPEVRSYTVALNLGADAISVTPTANVPTGSVTAIADQRVASGQGSNAISLDLGDNLIEVVVTAADGSSTRYQVTTKRGAGILQEAYVKASNTDADDDFGSAVAISDDGNTLAVGALFEASSSQVIGGDQNDNSAAGAGSVYVFVRNGTVWSQQAYLKASNSDAGDRFGGSLALSENGDTLAVGTQFEDSIATGIDGDETDNRLSAAGAAYVFVRSGTAWSQQAYIKASNTGTSDVTVQPSKEFDHLDHLGD